MYVNNTHTDHLHFSARRVEQRCPNCHIHTWSSGSERRTANNERVHCSTNTVPETHVHVCFSVFSSDKSFQHTGLGNKFLSSPPWIGLSADNYSSLELCELHACARSRWCCCNVPDPPHGTSTTLMMMRRQQLSGDLQEFLSADETAYELLLRSRRPNVLTGLPRLDRFIDGGKGVVPGECVTITGDHGSGKSTLLRSIILNTILPYVSCAWDSVESVCE